MSSYIDFYSESHLEAYSPLYNGGPTAYGQSFIGNGYAVDSCKFYLKKGGSPTGNAVAKLYAHTGTFGSTGTPTGAALATSGNFDVSTLTTSPELITFTFSSPYTTVSGTAYFIVIEYSGGGGSDYVHVGVDNVTKIHAGNGAYYTGSWTAESNDYIFYAISNSIFVAIRAVGDVAEVEGTSLTLTIPSGTQDGDLMVAFLTIRNRYALNDVTGWTKAYTASSGQTQLGIFYRVKQSGDGNPTFTSGTADPFCGVLISFYNVDTSTPLDVSVGGTYFDAPSSPYDVTISGFNTATNGAMALFMWNSKDDNTWAYQSGGGNEEKTYDCLLGQDCSFDVVRKTIATAGGTGDQVSRQTNKAADDGNYCYFAIKPAATGSLTQQAVSGTLAAQAGTLVAKAKKILSGTLPAQTGTLVRKPSKALTGTLPAPVGTITKKVLTALSGVLPAPSGTLTTTFRSFTALTGTVPAQIGTLVAKAKKVTVGILPAPSGVVTKKVIKSFSGTVPALTGSLLKKVLKTLSGVTPAPSGTLATKLTLHRTMSGTLPAQVGSLVAKAKKLLDGTLPAPIGSLTKKIVRSQSGVLPPSMGTLIKKVIFSTGGILPPPTGTLLSKFRSTSSLSGILPAPTGTLTKQVIKYLSGTLPGPIGVITKRTIKSFYGILPSPLGTLSADKITAPYVRRSSLLGARRWR